ncbi:DUF4129 domain-containing protein [Halovenus salina]|uniref:DUF4129 domain-containing protein n=1 Tax=Halovenus salina TaxID=1510225 RepID=A0ABD5W536_9EURY
MGFSSPVIFPGLPTHLSVTADGGGVDNATVVVGDDETTTNSGGSAWVSVPLADEVTVTATVGEEQATTTVSNLYLRTTLVVLVGPGLIIGAVWTYVRYIAARRREGFGAAVLGIAALLGGLSAAVFQYGSLSLQGIRSLRLPSLPSASFPRMSLPSLGELFSLGLPSLSKLVDNLSMSHRSGDNTVAGAVTDGEESTTGEETADERASESAVAGPQAAVRDAWHTFLAQLQIRDIETATPGEAARVALAAGYPAEQVRRLLSLFRAVEYGDSDPSTDDVADAQATVDTLTDYHPEEEEPQ